MENRLFYFGLMVSLIAHGTFFMSHSMKKDVPLKKRKTVEVTYQKITSPKIKKQEPPKKDLRIVNEGKFSNDVDMLMKEFDNTPDIDTSMQDISRLDRPMPLGKKQTFKIRGNDHNRKITVPLLKSDKITNPKYVSYNENIRQRIKQRAYSYVDHPDFDSGEVYLTFALAATGFLKQIKVIDARTSANTYLKDVGMRSVKESNPFPPFPKDLNYPELTFNVVISFEVKD